MGSTSLILNADRLLWCEDKVPRSTLEAGVSIGSFRGDVAGLAGGLSIILSMNVNICSSRKLLFQKADVSKLNYGLPCLSSSLIDYS